MKDARVRINLSFDLSDFKQKAVHDYLLQAGRQKTAVIVDAFTKQVSDQFDESEIIEKENEKALIDDIKDLVVRALVAQKQEQEKTMAAHTAAIDKKLQDIILAIEKLPTQITAISTVEPTQKQEEHKIEDEADDDAFAQMNAMLQTI